MTEENRQALVAALRVCAPFDPDQAQAADLIEADGRRIAQLESELDTALQLIDRIHTSTSRSN